MKLWKPRAACTWLVSASLMLSGCASPFIGRMSPPDVTKTYPKASMAYSLAFARSYQEAYRAKVIELAESERLLTNGLIMLGGLVIFGRTANVHSSVTNGLVIGGGLAYTLGIVNTDKRKGVVYIAGMQALQCANEAVQNTGADPESLAVDIADHKQAMSRTAVSLGAVRAMSVLVAPGSADANATLALATQSVTESETALSRANEALKTGQDLLVRQQQLGEKHIEAVLKIDTAVVDELRGIGGSIQQTPAILGELVTNLSQFSGLGKLVPPAPTNPPAGDASGAHALGVNRNGAPAQTLPPAASVAQLNNAIARLKAATYDMENSSTRLKDKASVGASNITAGFLDKCKIEKVALPLAVDKQVMSFTEKAADRQTLKVTGGKDNSYVVGFRSTVHPEISLRQIDKGLWEVATTDKVAINAAGYELDVKDLSGPDVTVLVKVVAKPAISNATPDDKGAGDSELLTKVKALTPLTLPSGTVVMFDKVTARPDGTPEVIYTPKDGKPATSQEVVAAVKNKLGAGVTIVALPSDGAHGATVSRAAKGEFGPVVKSMSGADVAEMQKILCMKPADMAGGWGKRTQTALENDRDRRIELDKAKDVPQGMIKEAEVKTLRDRTPEVRARYCRA